MGERPVMLVTGTSKGIGLGLARHFVGRGFLVAGCSRGASPFESEWYEHSTVDVTHERDVVDWVKKARSHFKRIDALVCNAGHAPAAQVLALTTSALWNEVMSVNAAGTFHACREVSRVMIAQRYGRIVTVSSVAAALHIEGTAAYAASKSAIVEMTKVLARECASVGVTCNVVSVSMVATTALESLGKPVLERLVERLTVKRPLEISEVANVVEFLCSPASAAVTGQVVQLGAVT